jgi:hypothetical protein
MKQVAIGRKNWLFIGSLAAGARTADLMTLVSSAIRNDLACLGLHQRRARHFTCWLQRTTIACAPTSGLRELIPSTSEPTAKTNAAIVPTANNALAKNEETPNVEPAKYQMVLVYAYQVSAICRSTPSLSGRQIAASGLLTSNTPIRCFSANVKHVS